METSNQKIPDIFANNYFRIPDYQRGYAWKADKQLPDLWDDIEDIPTNPSGGYKATLHRCNFFTKNII